MWHNSFEMIQKALNSLKMCYEFTALLSTQWSKSTNNAYKNDSQKMFFFNKLDDEIEAMHTRVIINFREYFTIVESNFNTNVPTLYTQFSWCRCRFSSIFFLHSSTHFIANCILYTSYTRTSTNFMCTAVQFLFAKKLLPSFHPFQTQWPIISQQKFWTKSILNVNVERRWTGKVYYNNNNKRTNSMQEKNGKHGSSSLSLKLV